MARKHQPAAVETLDEIQGAADRLAEWIQQNLVLVAIAIGGLLIAAAVGSYVASSRSDDEREAGIALAQVRGDYLTAMGASPGSLDVPELANPDAARRIREEYAGRFEAVAEAHPDTVSGALARLEVARLALDAGDVEGALAVYDEILSGDVRNDRLRGVVLQGAAQALESAGRWQEAAQRHGEAAALEDYPLRDWALADHARTLAAAGDRGAALEAYRTLDTRAPDLRLPSHLRMQKQELEAGAER
jgi:tetratricopeptide (TPR) repeat protein